MIGIVGYFHVPSITLGAVHPDFREGSPPRRTGRKSHVLDDVFGGEN